MHIRVQDPAELLYRPQVTLLQARPLESLQVIAPFLLEPRQIGLFARRHLVLPCAP